jgi:hypothetical protein
MIWTTGTDGLCNYFSKPLDSNAQRLHSAKDFRTKCGMLAGRCVHYANAP